MCARARECARECVCVCVCVYPDIFIIPTIVGAPNVQILAFDLIERTSVNGQLCSSAVDIVHPDVATRSGLVRRRLHIHLRRLVQTLCSPGGGVYVDVPIVAGARQGRTQLSTHDCCVRLAEVVITHISPLFIMHDLKRATISDPIRSAPEIDGVLIALTIAHTLWSVSNGFEM